MSDLLVKISRVGIVVGIGIEFLALFVLVLAWIGGSTSPLAIDLAYLGLFVASISFILRGLGRLSSERSIE